MFYPVQVPGALMAAGDPHAAQGDSELSGTSIEMSLTGVVQVVLHKEADTDDTILAGLDYPLLETSDEFIVHGFSFARPVQLLNREAVIPKAEHGQYDLIGEELGNVAYLPDIAEEAPTRAPDFDAGLDAAGAREAVVFVHGYDNTFAEGLYRQVQMHHDFALPDLAINYA